MDSSNELSKAKDEVLRRMGRNLLLFQQVEYMLKFLLRVSKASGTASKLKDGLSNKRMPMGNLIDPFVANFLTGNCSDDSIPLDNNATFSYTFTFHYTEPEREMFRDKIKSLVQQRNEFVHHFINRFPLNSSESCQSASDELERQREQIKPVREELVTLINTMREMAPQMKEVIEKHFNGEQELPEPQPPR